MKKSFGVHLPKKTVFDRFGLKTKNLLCTQMPRSLIWHYLFVWGSSTIIKKKITCLVNFSIFFSFFRKTSFWRICQLWLRIPEKLKILRTKVTAFFDSLNSHLLEIIKIFHENDRYFIQKSLKNRKKWRILIKLKQNPIFESPSNKKKRPQLTFFYFFLLDLRPIKLICKYLAFKYFVFENIQVQSSKKTLKNLKNLRTKKSKIWDFLRVLEAKLSKSKIKPFKIKLGHL